MQFRLTVDVNIAVVEDFDDLTHLLRRVSNEMAQERGDRPLTSGSCGNVRDRAGNIIGDWTIK
jgi:hypothetical protein